MRRSSHCRHPQLLRDLEGGWMGGREGESGVGVREGREGRVGGVREGRVGGWEGG